MPTYTLLEHKSNEELFLLLQKWEYLLINANVDLTETSNIINSFSREFALRTEKF